jgi:transketolase N-terminal domain/subunit
MFSTAIDLALGEEVKRLARFYVCRNEMQDEVLSEKRSWQNAAALKIYDLKNEVQILLSATKQFDGHIEAVCSTDCDDSSSLFQAYCVMPCFYPNFEKNNSWDVEFVLKFSH